MRVTEALAALDGCATVEACTAQLNVIIQNFGFAAFNFLDAGHPGSDLPFFVGTSGRAWEEEYASNRFVQVDRVLSHARRMNVPFRWSSVPMPHHASGPKPGAILTMEAARDHGFRDGFVCPLHFRAPNGRVYSTLIVLFWTSEQQELARVLDEKLPAVHTVLTFAMDRYVRLLDRRQQLAKPQPLQTIPDRILSDKEREVLSHIARGLTAGGTAARMDVAVTTVRTHMRSILGKLDAANITHAVAIASTLKMLDL